MDKDNILDLVNNLEKKPNRDLISAMDFLTNEYEKTKELTIELTRHMDTLKIYYEKIIVELEKRKKI